MNWSIHTYEWAHAYKHILQANILRKKNTLLPPNYCVIFKAFSQWTYRISPFHVHLSSHSSISLLTFRRKLTQLLGICVTSTPSTFVLFLNQLEPTLHHYHSTLTVVKKQFHAARSSGQLSVFMLFYHSKWLGTVGWSLFWLPQHLVFFLCPQHFPLLISFLLLTPLNYSTQILSPFFLYSLYLLSHYVTLYYPVS